MTKGKQRRERRGQFEAKRSGWDNGLCQDYSKGLGRWFSSRLDAREVVRRVAREIEAERVAALAAMEK
jgi:hypothetical protein